MRTTLTLDDDVWALLERVRERQGVTRKQLVNEALRRGLERLDSPPAKRKRYRTRPVALGRCLLGSLDDVAEALAVAEGERYR
jgi:hypothetical protein